MTRTTDERARQEGLKDQAATKVQDAGSVAQEKASELREEGSMRLRDQFDQRSNQAGSQVRSLAGALRGSSNDLSNEGNTNGARLAEQTADRIERFGRYLEQKRGDELMRDIEAFARRRPWMLTGLGMLAGIATARFMKASSEQRYGDYRRTVEQQWLTRQGGAPAPGGGHGGGEMVGGGYRRESGVADLDVPSASSDDPLARDPYAGTR